MRRKSTILKGVCSVIISVMLFQCFAGCTSKKNVEKEISVFSTENIAEQYAAARKISDKTEYLRLFKTALENETTVLKFIPQTGEIAFQQKHTGETWYSNPLTRIGNANLTDNQWDELSSQLSIQYCGTSGIAKTLNSGENALKGGQVKYDISNGSLTVQYTLGIKKKTIMVPQILTKDRMENDILSKLDEDDQRNLKRRYTLMSYNSLASGIKDTMITYYPILEETDCYILRDISSTYKQELADILKKIGYTEDDFFADEENNHSETRVSAVDQFNITVIYRLDGKDLTVEVPADKIEIPDDINLNTIQVLPYMAAQDETASGYIFVPDGSGALIYLNNGKTNINQYTQRIYGNDNAVPQMQKTANVTQAFLPVIGIKNTDNALLTIVEDGDGIVSAKANIAGYVNAYNIARFEFIITDKAETFVGSGSNKIDMFQDVPFSGTIKLRYCSLNGDNANYSGMARRYREYLEKKYSLEKRKKSDNKLTIELIGALDNPDSVAGIPVRTIKTVTSYSQAQEIAQSLIDRGIDNMNIRYLGWSDGGYTNKYNNKITLEKKVGKKNDYENYIVNMQSLGINTYFDVDFQHVCVNGLFDGFFTLSDIAGTFLKDEQYKYNYSPANFNPDDSVAVVSIHKLNSEINSYISGAEKMVTDKISLSYYGTELNSDAKNKKEYDRQQALSEIVKTASIITEKFGKVMISGANAYMIPYTENAIDLPKSSSGLLIEDQSVPFLQMVLSPYISYSNEKMNFSEDIKSEFLSAIETGASLYYQWTYADGNTMKKIVRYDNLYATDYRLWIDSAADYADEYDNVIGDSASYGIADHKLISTGCTLTEYGDGKKILVNKTKSDATVAGNTVHAQSYLVIDKGAEK